jgi:hypothetical protein
MLFKEIVAIYHDISIKPTIKNVVFLTDAAAGMYIYHMALKG